MPSEEQAYFLVTSFAANGQSRVTNGPFLCTVVPYSGNLQFQRPGTAQVVVADVRLSCPIDSGVRARSILTNQATSEQFEVVQAQRYPDRIVTYALRKTAQP